MQKRFTEKNFSKHSVLDVGLYFFKIISTNFKFY